QNHVHGIIEIGLFGVILEREPLDAFIDDRHILRVLLELLVEVDSVRTDRVTAPRLKRSRAAIHCLASHPLLWQTYLVLWKTHLDSRKFVDSIRLSNCQQL